MGTKYFTLIEMVVIIAIVAILATLLVPLFEKQTQRNMEELNIAQMGAIMKAFTRFSNDVRLPENELLMNDILQYGLWPLIQEQHPLKSQQEKIDYEKIKSFEHGKGRNMSYLKFQDNAFVTSNPSIPTIGASATIVGLKKYEKIAGSYTLPILLDPFGNPYQIIAPLKKQKSQLSFLHTMGLLSLGENGVLDLTLEDFNNEGVYLNKKSSDDVFIPLFPQFNFSYQGV